MALLWDILHINVTLTTLVLRNANVVGISHVTIFAKTSFFAILWIYSWARDGASHLGTSFRITISLYALAEHLVFTLAFWY